MSGPIGTGLDPAALGDAEFDRALVASAFAVIAERGYARLSVGAAARLGGLPLDRARARFPCRVAVLLRFGRIADQAALAGDAGAEGSVRDRLFEAVMRRIDVLQAHRAGVLALLRGLPFEPVTALLLAAATLRSMAWLLDGAGVPASGPLGALRAKALLAVWLWTVRAWQRDGSADLSATMAALDGSLARAEQAAAWLPDRTTRESPEAPPDEVVPPAPPPPDPPEAPPFPAPPAMPPI
ncbi:MAG: TetR family transcriptional regulator [Acidisphaera sp.]|nr:TetR family transcriptional regulator [Acidisphaera sp.]